MNEKNYKKISAYELISNPESADIIPTVHTTAAGTRVNRNIPFSALKGDMGPEGPVGPQGPQGNQGPQGIKGDKGDKGDRGADGTGVTILGTLDDESELPATGNPGDAYMIGGSLWVWSDTTDDWVDAGSIKGPQGEEGPQGPKGDKGDQGDPATNLVTSVAGKQGDVSLSKGDVGLGSVDNTADTAKPVSTAQQAALDAKLDDSQLDTDGTLAANSDSKIASQKATKTYVDVINDKINKEKAGQVSDYHAFGDSITYGTRSTDPAVNAYPVVLAGLKGWSVTNHGVPGAIVNDSTVLDAVMSQIVDETKNYSIMIGTNTARVYGMDLGYLDTYRGCLMNELVWLAIPDEHKIRGADCTTTGTWTENTKTVVGAGHGFGSSSTGATLETSVVGSTVYISTYATQTGASAYDITVDGESYGSWVASEHNSLETRDDLHTFSAYMIRISGLSQGAHTVKITTTTSSPCYIDWVAGNGYPRDVKGPNVWVSNIIRATQGQYDASSYTDEIVGLYNSTIRSVADDLAADNLNVCFVDSLSAINNTTDMYDSVDLHPNDTGYIKLANSFFATMSSYTKPMDRGGSQTHDTGWITLPLQNGWVGNGAGYGTPQFRKKDGRVELRGSMKGGTIANGTIVFQLPLGYRPSIRLNFPIISGGGFGLLRVYGDGNVRIYGNGNASYMSVDGMSFLADL